VSGPNQIMSAFDEAPSPAPAPAEEARHLAAVAAVAGVAVADVVLPEHEHVVLGGMRLHYLDWGSPGGGRGTPGGLPVVFLHGGGLTAHTWDIVCLALREEHRCFALDLRGHGDSEWSPALDYSLGAHLRDLEAFADHLGTARFFLVGQSLGGIIGIGYASRRPRRLAGLVRYSLQHNMRRLPDGRWTWKRDQRHLSRQRMAALVAQIRALAPQARAIACPTLIVRGADSDLFSADQAAAFAALLRDGTVVTIPDSGHNVQGDNPAGLLAAIRPFLGRHRAEAAR